MNPQPDRPSPSPEATGADSAGIIGRLSGIYFSPGETYPGIGRVPKFILAMVLMGIVAAISSFALTNRLGYETLVRKQMEPAVTAGWITQEQADEAVRRSTTGARATWGKIQGPLFAAIGYAIMILVLTAIFKLVSLVVGAENGFKSLLGVTAWTMLAIGILQTLVFIIVVYLKSPDDFDMMNPVGSNLGALLSASQTGKFLKALASWVDFFGIWKIVLLSIGYSAVSRRLSTGTAATVLIILYIIAACILSAFASMFS